MDIFDSLSSTSDALLRSALVVCLVLGLASGVQGAAANRTLYWKGTTASAATASNWCTDDALTQVADAAPVNGDAVVFTSASGNMTWDLDDVSLGSWTQQAGYAGTVTFLTGRKNGTTTAIRGWTDDDGETRVLKITGDCTLLGGTWKGTAQPDLSSLKSSRAFTSGEGVYSVMAHVGGSMSVTNATVSATGCGYYKGQGPATAVYTHGGGTHAGTGGVNSGTKKCCLPCYGTFREPVTIGSGGYWDGTGHGELKGGGSVYLSVTRAFSAGTGSQFLARGADASYYTAARSGFPWAARCS